MITKAVMLKRLEITKAVMLKPGTKDTVDSLPKLQGRLQSRPNWSKAQLGTDFGGGWFPSVFSGSESWESW